jgi:hypothetical protein
MQTSPQVRDAREFQHQTEWRKQTNGGHRNFNSSAPTMGKDEKRIPHT